MQSLEFRAVCASGLTQRVQTLKYWVFRYQALQSEWCLVTKRVLERLGSGFRAFLDLEFSDLGMFGVYSIWAPIVAVSIMENQVGKNMENEMALGVIYRVYRDRCPMHPWA